MHLKQFSGSKANQSYKCLSQKVPLKQLLKNKVNPKQVDYKNNFMKLKKLMKTNRENTKTENEDENLVLIIKDLKIDKLLAILIKKIKTQLTNIKNEKH